MAGQFIRLENERADVTGPSDDAGDADDALLEVFDSLGTGGEPLSTREVADALGSPRRTAYGRLERASERGALATKKVGGNVRVWWAADPDTDGGGGVNRSDLDLPNLTSDHALSLEFRSAALGEAFLAISPDIRMRLDGIAELEDGTVLQYLTISGAPVRDVFETLEGYPHVIDLRLIAKRGDEYRIEGHTHPDSMGKLFRAFGGTTETAYIDDGEFVIVGEVPPDSDIAELAAAAVSYYPDIELASVELDFTPRLFRSVVEERVTPKQWTTLTAAYYGGYFERPRKSTGDDVAAQLNVTRQTFHHHLRNAQNAVFRTLLEGFGESAPGAGELTSDE